MELTFPKLPVEGSPDFDIDSNALIEYFCATYIDMCNTTETDLTSKLEELLAGSLDDISIDDSTAKLDGLYSSDKLEALETDVYYPQLFYFTYSGNSSFHLGYINGVGSPWNNDVVLGGYFKKDQNGNNVVRVVVKNIDSGETVKTVLFFTPTDGSCRDESGLISHQTQPTNTDIYLDEPTHVCDSLLAIVPKG